MSFLCACTRARECVSVCRLSIRLLVLHTDLFQLGVPIPIKKKTTIIGRVYLHLHYHHITPGRVLVGLPDCLQPTISTEAIAFHPSVVHLRGIEESIVRTSHRQPRVSP